MLGKPSKILCGWLLFAATLVCAQQAQVPDSLAVSTKTLPKASLWEPNVANLQASGGIEPYHWHVIAGSLPRAFVLNESGVLRGVLDELGQFEITASVTDNENPPKQSKQQL